MYKDTLDIICLRLRILDVDVYVREYRIQMLTLFLKLNVGGKKTYLRSAQRGGELYSLNKVTLLSRPVIFSSNISDDIGASPL